MSEHDRILEHLSSLERQIGAVAVEGQIEQKQAAGFFTDLRSVLSDVCAVVGVSEKDTTQSPDWFPKAENVTLWRLQYVDMWIKYMNLSDLPGSPEVIKAGREVTLKTLFLCIEMFRHALSA